MTSVVGPGVRHRPPWRHEHRAARSDRDAGSDLHLVDLHDAVLEQVRLRTGQGIELAVIADGHAVKFRDVRGVEVHPGR